MAIDSTNLSENPNAGGGKRLYPGRQTPEASESNNIVEVEASASAPDLDVWFKVFDVDDPSSDSRPIDPNGSDGDDNRGCCNTVSPSSVTTGTDRLARTELRTTFQPGDNLKVVAGCDLRYLNDLEVVGTEIRDADGAILPTPDGKVSDLLTIWRKLHIEVDSMALVQGNVMKGRIDQVSYNARKNITTLDIIPDPADRTRFEPDGFEGGAICLANDLPLIDCSTAPAIDCYQVGSGRDVRNAANQIVTVHGQVAAVSGDRFVMVDDDDMDSNDCPDQFHWPDVPPPDLRFLQQSTDDPVKNVLAPAYIQPAYDLGGIDAEQVPFVLNLVDSSAASQIATYNFNYEAHEYDPEYWATYLLGSYQTELALDHDPDSESRKAYLGAADHLGASIFAEVLREAAPNPEILPTWSAITSVHEVGHLLGAEHGDKEVMKARLDGTSFQFSDASLNKIRYLDAPGAVYVHSSPIVNAANEALTTRQNKSLSLTLTAGDTEYLPGQLVDLAVQLMGKADSPEWDQTSLDVGEGFLRLLIAEENGVYKEYKGHNWGKLDIAESAAPKSTRQLSQTREFQILSHLVSSGPGQDETARIDTEYAFTGPGYYELRAYLFNGDFSDGIISNPLVIYIDQPRDNEQFIWSELRRQPEYGYFIQHGGPRGHARSEKTLAMIEDLETLVQLYPESRYAAQIRRALEKHYDRLTKLEE